MNAEKYVVMTTIHPPGKSATAFSRWDGWRVVVIGDRHTPEPWTLGGVRYVGIDEQRELFGEFADVLPENSYVRKMLGYTYAIKHGASVIFETDDDNLPYPDAHGTLENALPDAESKKCECLWTDNHWANTHRLFGSSESWPRGFPLAYIKDHASESHKIPNCHPVAITQFLVNGDPDVDAIYRITDGRPLHFARELRFAFDAGTYCPFNSQSTLWKPAAYALMFLPVGVSDRVTDILRGYVAQACLWKAGYVIGCRSPILFQIRNSHELHRDFVEEIPLYVNAKSWTDILLNPQGIDMAAAFRSSLKKLIDRRDIPKTNLKLYEMFLRAIGMEE